MLLTYNVFSRPSVVKYSILSNNRRCKLHAVIDCLFLFIVCSYQKTFHQFYLQLRQDILNGQLYCHEEASYLLGGLALQAETGDYNDILADEYFLPQHYIPKRV